MDLQDFYDNYYRKLHYSGFMKKAHSFIHQEIERSFDKNQHFGVVLELGADLGQHLDFVNHTFDQYWQTDLRDITKEQQFKSNKISIFKLNAETLDEIKDKSVDRIIATCLLAHLNNPEQALNNWKRVMKQGGVISIYVPCEPGIFLRIARYFTTVRKSKKMGLDHKSILYREHRNIWILCDLLISEIFLGSTILKRRFPLRKLSWNFNLFEIYQITINE
jgi:SAM-dependent methyltransferase